MRNTLASIAVGVAMAALASLNAQALPAAPSSTGAETSDVTLVAGGCGIGWHRGPAGVCRPNGPRAVVVAPAPVVVAPAAPVVVEVAPVCPPGFHLGPRGRACRPNY